VDTLTVSFGREGVDTGENLRTSHTLGKRSTQTSGFLLQLIILLWVSFFHSTPWVICVFSLISLAEGLPILFIFSKN
jgi:hypothetical protein